jgi:outer membrane protein
MQLKQIYRFVVGTALAGAACGQALAADLPAPPAAVPFPAYGTPLASPPATRPVTGVPSRVTLPQAIAVAAAQSPALASARAAYHISEADVELAKVPLNPSLSVQGQYQSQGGAYLAATPSTNATLSLSKLLYDGGKTIAQIRAAKGVAAAAGQTYRRALETLAFNVAQAYYGALLAQNQTRLQLQIVDQDLVQERLIAAQIRAGTAARIDLETAQIPTAQARVAVVRAQGAELAADAAFVNVLGLPADAAVLPSDESTSADASSLPQGTTLDYDRAVARALAIRPDYLAAQAQFASAQQSVRAARLIAHPSISVAGTTGYGFNNGNAWEYSSQANATLAVPIYDQGNSKAQTLVALAQQDQAAAAVDVSHLGVESDVRQSLVQLIAAQAALAQTADELAKARDVLVATQTQYRAGQTTLPLLLNAQTQLAGAETDRLTALYALRQAEQTYLYALGENVPGEGVPS